MIELKENELKKFKYSQKKRINQKKFNILNYQDLINLKYELDEKLIKKYSKYDDELKNIKIYKNQENNIYKLELLNYDFYLRDKIELSFIFNKYFSIEYLDEKSKYKNFIDFHKSKKFYMIENKNIIIFDYEFDLIKK